MSSCSTVTPILEDRTTLLEGGWGLHPDLYHWDLPGLLNLEVTNDCNLKCVHCFHSYFDFPKGRFDPAVFERLRPLLLRLGKVSLSGAGEPLLNPAFDGYLDWCAEHDLQALFTTHGHFLDRHIDHLVGRNVVVTLSMDASTPETYQSQRGASFERLIGNIEQLHAAKQAAGTPFPLLQMNFVASRNNAPDLPGLIELAARLGVSTVYCFHQVFYSDEHFERESLFCHQEEFDAILGPTMELAAKLGINFLHPGTFDGLVPIHPAASDYLAGTVGDFDCKWIHSISTVAWNGIVESCCFADRMLMGNVHENAFEDIWNGPVYRKLRLDHVRRDYPDACNECIFRQALTRQEKASFNMRIKEGDLYTDAVPALDYALSDHDPTYRQACEAILAGQPEAALEPLESLEQVDAEFFEATNARGVALARLGRREQARVAFGRAAEANPRSGLVAQNAALLM